MLGMIQDLEGRLEEVLSVMVNHEAAEEDVEEEDMLYMAMMGGDNACVCGDKEVTCHSISSAVSLSRELA